MRKFVFLFELKASDIEFNLPQTNDSVNTFAHLQEKHPDYKFPLIMGEDHLKSFHKWKNYAIILENHHIYVSPRISESNPDSYRDETQFEGHKKIHLVDAPIMQCSSTFIRKAIKAGKNIEPILPKNVWNYLDEMNFYK